MFKKLLIAALIGSASFSAMAYTETENEIFCLEQATNGMHDDGLIAKCLSSAKKGEVVAQAALGFIYMLKASDSFSKGLEKDNHKYLNEALKWAKKAANQKKNPEIAREAKALVLKIETLQIFIKEKLSK